MDGGFFYPFLSGRLLADLDGVRLLKDATRLIMQMNPGQFPRTLL
jgi:hypothetical protein